MKLFKILATTLLLTISTANAAPKWQWLTNIKIKAVRVVASGNAIILAFNKSHSACKRNFWVSVSKPGTQVKGLQDILSAALTAAAADKFVDVMFDSAYSTCEINTMIVRF